MNISAAAVALAVPLITLRAADSSPARITLRRSLAAAPGRASVLRAAAARRSMVAIQRSGPTQTAEDRTCPIGAVKCGPPVIPKPVVAGSLALNRTASVSVKASTYVSNRDSQSAEVDISVWERGHSTIACEKTRVLAAGQHITLTCIGGFAKLRRGRHTLQVTVRSVGIAVAPTDVTAASSRLIAWTSA